MDISQIKTREDFLEFMRMLQQHTSTCYNSNLPDYLGGIESWVEDMDGYFNNIGDQEALNKLNSNCLDWKILAHILYAATMYE